MAGATHLAIGLAAKRVAPKIPLWALIVAAYAIDIVWGCFWLLGIEKYPADSVANIAPWSHGLFMSLVWTTFAYAITKLISRDTRASVVIGALVFSHWVVDFIAKPMSHAFPSDVGLPLFFAGSPIVGLGLWRTAMGVYIGEYGTLIVGIAIYVWTVIGLKKDRSLPVHR